MSEEFEASGAEPVTDDPEADVDGDAQAPGAGAAPVSDESRTEVESVAGAPATEGEPGVVNSERTGNHAVDRVLDSLDELPDKPIEEHVAVFERAHEQLRGALDGPRPPKP